MCVYGYVHYTHQSEEKAFQLPHAPPGCPGSAGEEARDITQLLNCYPQVSPSAGAVLIEAETPSRSTAIRTHTHRHTYPSGRGVWGPVSWLWLPGLMGRNRGHKGSRRVSQIGPGGGQRDTRGQRDWASREATCHSISPVMNRPGFFSLCLVSIGNFQLHSDSCSESYCPLYSQYMQIHPLHVCVKVLVMLGRVIQPRKTVASCLLWPWRRK